MEHYWWKIDGDVWFDYDEFYSLMVKKFGDGSLFVEVGCHEGRSTSFLAVEILNSGKKIKLDCVDWWMNGKVYKAFKNNIEPVSNLIEIVHGISWDCASLYENESINFCFIDAGHDYGSVYKDITAWMPKVRRGGIIAGHDYNPNEGQDSVWVSAVVNEVIGKENIRLMKNVWIYEKP